MNVFSRLLSFGILLSVKVLGTLFYRVEANWLDQSDFSDFKNVRVIAFLNHTSLFEPLFLAAVPTRILWELSQRMVACGADITLERPIVGRFWRYFSPKMISLTRKRDESWSKFLKHALGPQSIVTLAPEGRMMRPNGLDKDGNPMSIRGGIVDVLKVVKEGELVLIFSGGLHHVHYPGQKFPHFFKTIKMNLERHTISSILASHSSESEQKTKLAIVQWLSDRMRQGAAQ